MLKRLLIMSVLCACRASANDSAAAIAAGGLVLTNNDKIILERERLQISSKRITVDYVFHNPTATDVEVLIAFPLPDLDASKVDDFIEGLRSTGRSNPADVVGFSVEVDGKSTKFSTEQKAYLGPKDVTADLAKYRLPLLPWFPEPDPYRDALRRLTVAQREQIVKSGLVNKDSLKNERSDTGNGYEWDPVFRYVVRTKHFWTQTFKKNARVKIRHQYTPMTGTFYGPSAQRRPPNPEWKDEARSLDEKGLCGSRSDFFQQKPWRDNEGVGPCAAPVVIEYILTTANNWSGPIRSFDLTLNEMPFVFTCFPDLKRVGKDRWRFTAKNFRPTSELIVAACR